MTDQEFQRQLIDDAALIVWRNEVDLPRVRTRIREHIEETGRAGQYLKILTLCDQLMDTEEELYWRCKRYGRAKEKNAPYSSLAFIAFFIPENLERLQKIERKREHLRAVLFRPETAKKDTITDDMIEMARDYPIESLLDFNRQGFALCLWHDDHNPSLHKHKNKNRVKCFACGEKAGAIDVYMKLYGVDFMQAVRALQ